MLSTGLQWARMAQGQRVDNYLAKILKGVPKSHIYRILRSGEVRVNRRRVGARYAPQRRRSAANSADPRIGAEPPQAAGAGRAEQRDAAHSVRGRRADRARQAGRACGPRRQRHCVRRHRARCGRRDPMRRSSSSCIGSIATRPACCWSRRSGSRSPALHAQLRDGAIDKRYSVLVRGKWRDAMRTVELPLATYVTGDGERRVRVDADGRLARTVFRRLEGVADARSAGRAARGRARHRTHAPDPRASDAPRVSARRRRQVRRLRLEQGARAPGAQADVPARAAHPFRASARRRARWSSRRRSRPISRRSSRDSTPRDGAPRCAAG